MTTQKEKDYTFLWRAIGAGVAVAIIVYFGSWVVGGISNWKAKTMLEYSQPTLRFLASTIMGATTTVLALILTLLSISSSRSKKMKGSHYKNIRRIAGMCTITFVGALFLLMFLNVPLKDTEHFLDEHFLILYHGIQIYAALLGGLLMVTILLLYRSAVNMINIADPEKSSDHYFIQQEEDVD